MSISKSLPRPLLQTYLRSKDLKSVTSHNNINRLNTIVKQSSRTVATLNIEPKVSLVDERIQTVIKGLKPHEKGKSEKMC